MVAYRREAGWHCRSRRIWAVALAVLGVAVLISPAARSTLTQGASPGDPGIDGHGPLVPPAHIPDLTAGDRGAVERVVEGDAQLHKLLAGHGYRITDMGVWTTTDAEKLGAIVQLSLAEPARLRGNWPQMDYNDSQSASTPYTVTTLPLEASNVQQLMVLVDLKRNDVVSIQAAPGSTVTPTGPVPKQPRQADD
jgi:hypothetical protein